MRIAERSLMELGIVYDEDTQEIKEVFVDLVSIDWEAEQEEVMRKTYPTLKDAFEGMAGISKKFAKACDEGLKQWGNLQ